MLDTVTSDQIEYAFDPTGKVFLLLLLPLTIQRSLPFSVDLRQVYVEWSGALECCSGFKVSQMIVLSARHVCSPTFTDRLTGEVYNLDQVYIDFSDLRPTQLGDVVNSDLCFTLEIIPHPANVPPIDYSYILPDGTSDRWTPDDFCFLRLCDNRRHREKFQEFAYVYPIISPALPNINCLVLGFSDFMDEATFLTEYPGLKVSYRQIHDTFSGFNSKVASLGVPTQMSHNRNLWYHNAPSLPGMSGGMFRAYDAKTPKGFSGVHVGGCEQIKKNFAVHVTNVSLALNYFKAISIDSQDFQTMDRASLKPYYDHFANQLP